MVWTHWLTLQKFCNEHLVNKSSALSGLLMAVKTLKIIIQKHNFFEH